MQSMYGCSIAVDDAPGHLGRRDPERGVDGRDDPVQLLQQLVVVVGRAVGQDVGLGPDQHLDPVEPVVDPADQLDLALQPVGRDVVAEPVRCRVVGDRDVLQPALERGPRHLLGGVAPVGGDRVHVQVALQVLLHDQLGDHEAGVELAAVLAQLRRDVGQAEALVHRLLGLAPQRLAGRVVGDPVLGDVQALAHGALAQAHVVVLGPREVLQQVAELVGLDHAQVDADAVVGPGARRVGAGVAGRLDQVDVGERRRERRGVGGGGDDVEVLDRVGEAPDAAGDLDPDRRRVPLQLGDDRVGQLDRAREQDARRRLLGDPGRERLQDRLLELGPEALDRPRASGPRRRP